MVNTYEDFQDLRNGTNQTKSTSLKEELKNSGILIDSLQNLNNTDLMKELDKLDSTQRKKVEKFLPTINNNITQLKVDTSKTKRPNWNFSSGSDTFNKMVDFQKTHPDTRMDDALDSLKMTKNLWNRFLYSRAIKIQGFFDDTKEESEKLTNEILSSASISIFIFLPIFTLFLKLLYARRKYTYVEHLIFVFHTQTVFFLLLLIFFLAGKFSNNDNIVWIFLILFLGYLFAAMKKFYKQGFIKTFIKFFILNNIYMMMASIGLMIVSVIAFAMY